MSRKQDFVFTLVPQKKGRDSGHQIDCWFNQSLHVYFWSDKSCERKVALEKLKVQVENKLMKMANDGEFPAFAYEETLQESLVVSIDLDPFRSRALAVCRMNTDIIQ